MCTSGMHETGVLIRICVPLRHPVQYVAPDGTPIEILARLGEALTLEDLKVQVHSHGDVNVNVATPETLYGCDAPSASRGRLC
jgi:hypothetical protein